MICGDDDMKPWDMVLPKVAETDEVPGINCCSFGKLDWIEVGIEDDRFAAECVQDALNTVGWKTLPIIPRNNLGTRNRITLLREPSLAEEEYTLTIGHDTIIIRGGGGAGVFYGVQSLAQIIGCSAQAGGRELILPAGVIKDRPRFPWRGVMLDSARHWQPLPVIFRFLDRMAEYKLNVFHWHFVDRQGWRPDFKCAPGLTADLAPDRSYSTGSYSREDMIAVRDYAAKRFIRVVPELEMPGHSAVVFRTYPALTCCIPEENGNPYSLDAWEFCISNPEAETFLVNVLKEIIEIFPDSPVLHIGGDEAGITRWKRCEKCQKMIREKGLSDERALEHDFMCRMAEHVVALGREPMTWGLHDSPHQFDPGKTKMIVQDWLGGNDTINALRNGCRVVSSVHHYNYFDYPSGDAGITAEWQKKNYEFDPLPQEATADEAKLLLGGEGCLWTEQLPFQRTLPRAVPRMRALAEMLWTPPQLKDFDDFQLRERLIINSGIRPYA